MMEIILCSRGLLGALDRLARHQMITEAAAVPAYPVYISAMHENAVSLYEIVPA